MMDFGKLHDDLIGLLEKLPRLGNRHSGHRRGHVENIPFIERRHEFRPNPAEGDKGNRQKNEGADDDPLPVFQHEGDDRGVRLNQEAIDGIPIFRKNSPPNPIPHKNWNNGDGEDCRRCHRVRLGKCERTEEPPLLIFQREHGDKRHRDHEEGIEQCRSDFLGRILNDRPMVPPLIGRFQRLMLNVLMGVFDHDDGGIHHRTNGDGYATQRHDIRINPLSLHDNEGNEYGSGKREDRHERASSVKQEQDADQGDNENFFGQLVFERANRAIDEPRSVVRNIDRHIGRKPLLEEFELLLDAIDDFQGVFSIAHDDDAARDFPFAIALRKSAPHQRSDGDVGNVLDTDGGPALRVNHNRDVPDVINGLDVAKSAHHELHLPHLDHFSADIVVRVLNGHLDHGERHLVGEKFCRIDRDLILFDIAAYACNLGYARNRSQPVLQVPILNRAKLLQRMRLRRQSVLEHPSNACGIGSESRHDIDWQPFLRIIQVFQHAAPGPIQIRPVLEDDIDQ